MAAGSLLALLDDIATILDDVALFTKIAAKKTTGVLGDDLALNAEQVSGVRAERELPVVWAVAKGSLGNKVILVPSALAISALAPWAVTPLLMVGGAYLCFEGFEKTVHKLVHRENAESHHAALKQTRGDPNVDLVSAEKGKIRGAIRTDFILSAEIIVISLGTVAHASFATQAMVVCGIAILMTVGVYGVVAGIVKLDDAGLWLIGRPGEGVRVRLARVLGAAILKAAPRFMTLLTIAGTVAMFLVGGGILVHGIAPLHHSIEDAALAVGGVAGSLLPLLADAAVGIAAGALVLAGLRLVQRLRRAA